MSRGRADGSQKKNLVAALCVLIFLGFLFVYYDGSFFGSQVQQSASSLRKLGSTYLGGEEDADLTSKSDEPSIKFGQEDEKDIVPKSFPVCDDRHSEIIPCLDRNLIYQSRLKLDLSLMEHYERHCPLPERRFNCLIPPPPGYKVPIEWPRSRDEVWKPNIPHTHLASEKSDQNWMVVKGEKISFPGGGTHFHYGADKYIASLANMLNFSDNNLNSEGNVRTVLDVGCGVASFGAYLLSSNIIAMSVAPNDVHQNQIQFALERGIPAYLGVLGTMRLPYPSRSFELAHCSHCRIDWLQRDGILLLELDRLLRPEGYFAYSSPELNITLHDHKDLSGQKTRHPAQFTDGKIKPGIFSDSDFEYCWTDEEIENATGESSKTVVEHPSKLRNSYATVKGIARDSLGEPSATSYHSMFLGTVDYLWHSNDLVPTRVLDTPSIDLLLKTHGCQTREYKILRCKT